MSYIFEAYVVKTQAKYNVTPNESIINITYISK